MEELARRFCRQALERQGLRYSQELRQVAVEYAKAAEGRGEVRREIAETLGLCEATLSRWLQGSVQADLHEVVVVEGQRALWGTGSRDALGGAGGRALRARADLRARGCWRLRKAAVRWRKARLTATGRSRAGERRGRCVSRTPVACAIATCRAVESPSRTSAHRRAATP
jgi:hypothetical protein